MKTKTILLVISILALIASLIWLMVNPGWEPLVAALVAVGALVAQIKFDSDSDGTRMKQKGGKNSTNYQAAGDINVKRNDKR